MKNKFHTLGNNGCKFANVRDVWWCQPNRKRPFPFFSIYRKSNCIGIQLFVNKIKNKLDSFCINGGKFLNAGDVDVNSSDRK